MDKLIIQGNAVLSGEVSVSGSKNASLPILAATLLTEEPCIIENVPPVRDVTTMIRILRHLGLKVLQDADRISVYPKGYKGTEAPYRLVSTMRASFCVLGPLLARKKRARVSLPGGCVIGPRPVDLHLKGLSALGAELMVREGYVMGTVKALHGRAIYLGGSFGSSVLGTANVLMAAVLAQGTTVIENAACEPELVDLAQVLIQMGARIEGHGTPTMTIEGVGKLGGFKHRVIPDRIEAGTFLIGSALLKSPITVKGARVEHLGAVIDTLREAGVHLTVRDGGIRVSRRGALKAVDVTTLPYPGFPTDMQAQMTALMTQTPGVSVITEKIYPERFMHAAELGRMGARIKREGASAIIHGVERLSGAPVMASDLRASAALVLAALAADGKSEIARIYHLDRGYDRIDQKLIKLGAKIKRIKE